MRKRKKIESCIRNMFTYLVSVKAETIFSIANAQKQCSKSNWVSKLGLVPIKDEFNCSRVEYVVFPTKLLELSFDSFLRKACCLDCCDQIWNILVALQWLNDISWSIVFTT